MRHKMYWTFSKSDMNYWKFPLKLLTFRFYKNNQITANLFYIKGHNANFEIGDQKSEI